MNKVNQDIHTLCEEVLPLYDELSPEAQDAVSRHMHECEICREKKQSDEDFNRLLSSETVSSSVSDEKATVKKFSGLIWYKRISFWIILLVKAFVLFIIGKDFINLATTTEAPLGLLDEGVRSMMLIYYLPFSFIMYLLSIYLVKKRYLLIILILDIFLYIFFDEMLVNLVS